MSVSFWYMKAPDSPYLSQFVAFLLILDALQKWGEYSVSSAPAQGPQAKEGTQQL
jgi:hypothetical protein